MALAGSNVRLTCFLVLILGGCHPADDRAVIVDFWALGSEGEIVRELVPRFEAAHRDVRVRVQQIPWSAAHEKLLTALVGGTMPDVFQMGSTWVAEFAVLGALEPLDGSTLPALAPGERDDFFGGILAAGEIGGVVFGLPWYVDTRVLFVRRDRLDDAGCPDPLPTWSAWVDCMSAVKRKAGAGSYAILLPLLEWETPVILSLQNGASLLREDDGRGNFQSPEFREAFAFYTSLFARGLAPQGGEAQATSLSLGFAEGLFSFVVTGPWNLGQFRDRLPESLSDAWTTMPMPAAPNEVGFPGVSLAGGASLALWRGSPHKEAARAWMEFLVAPEQQRALHRLSGDLPARRSAWRALSLDEAPRTRAFWTQLSRAEPPPRVAEWERIAAAIGATAEAVVRGDVGLDEGLASLDADVDEILEKRRWLAERGALPGAARPEAP